MIIAVSANLKELKDTPFAKQFCLASGYVESLQRVKHKNLSVCIVPFASAKQLNALLEHTSGIILSGGYDVNPTLYNEKAHKKLGALCKKRDEFELNLIKEALRREICIFGICRGLQLLNVYFGGTLYQDLKSFGFKEHTQKKSAQKSSHSVNISKNSFLSRFLPEKIKVNSFHHQAIKELGKGLKAVAHSKEGIVEAVEYEKSRRLVFGVQWHPEAMRNAHSKALFAAFVKECEKG